MMLRNLSDQVTVSSDWQPAISASSGFRKTNQDTTKHLVRTDEGVGSTDSLRGLT